jgi:hypothetical protein
MFQRTDNRVDPVRAAKGAPVKTVYENSHLFCISNRNHNSDVFSNENRHSFHLAG